MGLSNARRALVVDSNPWNRRQICDVLAKKGYEVSACDSLSEGRKFYRLHPIVVAGGAEEPAELASFFQFVRGAAGEDGGYVIQLSTEAELGQEIGLDVDDVIGPALDAGILEATFQRADDWLDQHVAAAPETEIISSAPAGVPKQLKTQTKPEVKTDIEHHDDNREKKRAAGASGTAKTLSARGLWA